MYQTPPTVVPNKLMRNSEISELLQGYLGGGGGSWYGPGFQIYDSSRTSDLFLWRTLCWAEGLGFRVQP